MQRKLSSRFGKSSASEEFISQHMSNHYRRILNAKKVVDTSAPHSYKAKKPANNSSIMNKRNNQVQNRNESPAATERSMSTNSYRASSWGAESVINSSRFHSNCVPLEQRGLCSRRTLVDMDLINQIAYDTKRGPAVYCDTKWMLKQEENNDKHNCDCRNSVDKPKTAVSAYKPPLSIKCSNDSNQTSVSSIQKKSKVISKQTQSYTSLGPKPRPRKIEAVSKLRSLRVYYPPRRKKKRDESENCPGISHEIRDKRLEICICSSNPLEVKKITGRGKEQTSSRDSAYNGGVSSLPESRSPTPDQRTKFSCICPEHGEIYIKESHFYEKVTKPQDTAPEPDTKPPPEKLKQEEEVLKQMKEDALYVKFVQDITVEILQKGLFTNKALKKVMRKHIINNLETLDKDRMIREVENLRIQLGVPQDKSILDVDSDKDDSVSLVLKTYPVVSDSALTFTESVIDNRIDAKQIPKTISQVLQIDKESDLDSSSDDDAISMIQVAKQIQERHSPLETSSDEVNKNKKKRSKVGGYPRERHNPKGFFSYSSESEESNKKPIREPRKKPMAVDKTKSKCTCKGKNDCLNDKLEGKHIKLVIYEDELQKNNPKTKPKND